MARATVELVCSWCESPFVGGNEGKSSRRYCSRSCEGAAKSARYSGVVRSAPSSRVPWSPCEVCSSFFVRRTRSTVCSEECRRARRRQRSAVPRSVRRCPECGIDVLADRVRVYCSDGCRRRYRRRIDKRARTQTKRITVEQIGERDGWRCHICKRKVSRKNATRDHLIPQADGGAWIESNLALAHLRCNSSRGRGRIPAQLRLGA